ncbi:MAG: Eco57I restriction-modification methylase domain-containing protein, partial [Caldilinea sp.]
MEELGKQDPAELKRLLLERVGRSFAREAAAGDVGGQLLGREAGAGVHLLQLLGRRYAVVCTNPPYMGSKNMDALLKRYVEQHYKTGKRDLYAAFILRCLDLGGHASTIAMVTLGTWATQTSFMGLRQAILQHYELLSVVQLGRHAF